MNNPNLHTIAVVGSGAMGAGIAQIAMTAGLKVILHDVSHESLQRAKSQIRARLERMVEKGRASQSVVDGMDNLLILADNISALATAQLVIEAIVERLDAKQALFAELENVVGRDTVLATNTSSLSVAAIARSCQHRNRVCGMHFFNPVPLMKLVEVIATPDTSDDCIATAMAFSELTDKTAVRVKDVPGFLVNLLGRAFVTEALHVRNEGVADECVIDEIMREAAGFRMGPFELMDLTGIDVNFPATQYIYSGFQQDPRLKTTILHEALFNAGRFGRKTGQGYHRYNDKGEILTSAPATAAQEVAVTSFFAEHAEGFEALERTGLPTTNSADTADAVLISPRGEDAASACLRLGLSPEKVVAVDFIGIDKKFLTLMAPLGGKGVVHTLAAHLRQLGYRVVVIKDSPGFVAPRLLAMIANLGCEVAQLGVAEKPEDIDTAMRLAQNYPRGPLEWAEQLGLDVVYETLQQLQAITGSDRYRPSLWLRRRALLKLPVRMPD